jgi:hypothetical protein
MEKFMIKLDPATGFYTQIPIVDEEQPAEVIAPVEVIPPAAIIKTRRKKTWRYRQDQL